jgi:hypothetical protein
MLLLISVICKHMFNKHLGPTFTQTTFRCFKFNGNTFMVHNTSSVDIKVINVYSNITEMIPY